VTSPAPRPAFRSPRLIAALALLGAGTTLALLWSRDPSASSGLFPPCLWHELTGTACPGCGITRAIHHLLHGRFATAADYNAVGLLVLLATTAILVRPLGIALVENRWQFPAFTRRFAWGLLLAGLLWGLVRNIPCEPFTYLAP
jgi:hypothetical protein